MKFIDIIFIVIGYLVGSVSFAIVIGKVFFHKDVRDYGSGNPGGTNAGRAFGIKTGIIVILLDTFKAFIVTAIAKLCGSNCYLTAGLAAIIGHCYPIYYRFKGGKAVSSSYGFILAICLFDDADFIFSFLYPFLIFILLLGLFKMMSVASIGSLLSSFIITLITSDVLFHKILIGFIVLLVIWRHRANIKRILNGTESKLKFIK